MNKRKNCKGGTEIISIYWFAILIIIAGGVFLMVYNFYGAPYDVRELESRILMNQVADCVSYNGKINPNLIMGETFASQEKFLENCHLNFSSSDQLGQYYSEVNFYSLNDLDNPIVTLRKGNKDLTGDCVLQTEKKYEKLAQCTNGEFYSVDNANNQYLIKILTIVRRTEENVRL
jgi:hypothetical protein